MPPHVAVHNKDIGTLAAALHTLKSNQPLEQSAGSQVAIKYRENGLT
jgi:hypothetical protein